MKKILAYVISIIAVAVLITGCEQVHTHEFGEWDEVKVSSCIEDGKRVRLCECGEAEEEIISATGHVEEVIAEKTASCTKSGLTEGKKCSVCGVITVKQEAVEALGHEEKALDAVAPTCDADGLTEGVECSRCGKILVAQDSVAAIGHSYVYYVDENGEDYMLCTRDDCGATVENAAGLYDEENNLLLTWEDLVNTYEITDDLYNYAITYRKNPELQKGATIVIDDSVKTIGEAAFIYCRSFKNIILPSNLEEIGRHAFNECTSLERILIPDSVTSIGSSAFEECTSLTEIVLPKNLTYIPNRLLCNSVSLKNIEIPSGVTEIGIEAFAGCKSLTEIKIPASVIEIYNRAFENCQSMKNIFVDEDNENFKSIDGNLYDKAGKTFIQYAIAKTDEEFVVPDGVESIKLFAFRYSHSLKSITIPSSVTSIGVRAFDDCASLKNVYFLGTAEQWKKVDNLRHWVSNDMLFHYDGKVQFYTLGFEGFFGSSGAVEFEQKIVIDGEKIYIDDVLYNVNSNANDYVFDFSRFVIPYIDISKQPEKIEILEKIKGCEKTVLLEGTDGTKVEQKIICYVDGVLYVLTVHGVNEETGAYIIIRINSAILDVPGIDPTPITTKAFVDFDEIEIFYEENKEKIGINFLCLKAASNAENGIYVVNEWMELQKYIFEYDDENEEKFVNPRLKVEFEIYSIELGTDTDPTLDIPFHSFSVEFLSNGCSRIPVDLRMEFVDCSDADCRCNRTVYVYDGNELVGEIYLSFSLNISNDWFISFLKNNMFVLH